MQSGARAQWPTTTTPELEAVFVRNRHLLVQLMAAGCSLEKLRTSTSWLNMARMHRMLPDIYPAPISIYQAHRSNRDLPEPPGDSLSRVFPWVPKAPKALHNLS